MPSSRGSTSTLVSRRLTRHGEKFARGQKESIIPGTGLGLAICEAIIEAHDGRIWAEHRTPHGARFIFTLLLDEQPVLEPEARP